MISLGSDFPWIGDDALRDHDPTARACPPPRALSPCAAIDQSTAPQFIIPFRRTVLLKDFKDLAPGRGPNHLACVPIKYTLSAAIVLGMHQCWNLQRVAIGDLSTTITLAPLEKLTLEIQASQRRLLEQATTDSAEQTSSTESTTLDKEVVNVVRSASKTEKWQVDGNGSVNIGVAKLGASGGYSSSTTNATNSSIQQIHESSRKAANSLKTLHKIEVKGTTESFVQNRMARTIVNPYHDRTLTLHVFQLVKHFAVETALDELRLAFCLDIADMEFDAHFVAGHADFLRRKLIDSVFLDHLSTAVDAATSSEAGAHRGRAVAVARIALRFLFDERNVFSMPLTGDYPGGPDPNDVEKSFSATVVDDFDNTALGDALWYNESQSGTPLAILFLTMNMYYKIYKSLNSEAARDEMAIDLAVSLAAAVKKDWEAIKVANVTPLNNMFDTQSFTEVFRRIPGFLATAEGMLSPLLGPAEEEKSKIYEQLAASRVLGGLIAHLNCNATYYTQELLADLSVVTKNQAIVELARRALSPPPHLELPPPQLEHLLEAVDVERAFLHRQQIVIPSRPVNDDSVKGFFLALGDRNAPFERPHESCVDMDMQVPCDGVHMEAVAGTCILKNVPQPAASVDLSLQGASIRATAYPPP